jgi:glycosyltransferase involved in cell wall biosynthesis
MKTKINVIMSVFDGEEYLKESIESILGQSFCDFNFMIADDCSTDSTPQILKEYQNIDSRIKIIKNIENIGLTKSLNKLLRNCDGEFIARIDADDVSYKDRLEKQLFFLETNQNCEMTASCCDIINENSERVGVHCPPFNDTILKWNMVFINPIRHSTTMWRNNYLYDENYEFAQDYDMWNRIKEIKITNEVLGAIRIHEKTITNKKIKQQDECLTEIVRIKSEKYLEKKISINDAKILRYIFIHKHYLQIQEMDLIEIENFKKYISIYFNLVLGFIKKEKIEESILEAEITNDLINLIDFAKNKKTWTEFILIELHKVFIKSNEKIIKKIINNILKIKEKKIFI